MTNVSRHPRVPAAAWLSLLFGLASVPLLLVGVPAFLVSLRTLRTIHASDGELYGARLAQAGMVAAACGLVLQALGVVAILAISAQAKSKRVECGNHLREIGLALDRFADAQEAFPPAARLPADLLGPRRLSWLSDVLPLLTEGSRTSAAYQSLAASVDVREGWDAPANADPLAARVGLFHCPAHDGPVTNATHYVGLTGVGPDAIGLSRADPRAGLFGYDRGVKRQEVTAGISFTMMALETAFANGPWLAGGFPTARGLDPGIDHYSGSGRPFGGLHTNVVQVLWVDASVRPMTDSTPGALFRKLATIRRDDP